MPGDVDSLRQTNEYLVPSSLTVRLALGAALALLVAAAAQRAHSLTSRGALAAIVVGVCAVAAGWSWAALLLFFFLTSTALTTLEAETKAERSKGRMAKTGARDAAQVIANGGVFAVAAAAFTTWPSSALDAFALGGLATATADTWATEIGLLAPQAPRSIVTRAPVEPGTSGGVTTAGLLAGCAGALSIACVATLVRHGGVVAIAAATGGVAGLLTDSVVGATLQARYHCARCDTATERTVHVCGAPTRHAHGWRVLDNDGVNFLATAIGAGVAAGVFALARLAGVAP